MKTNILLFEDGFNAIVDEDNEMIIRDILRINRINWCFDMDNVIWVDWDNLPYNFIFIVWINFFLIGNFVRIDANKPNL